jgi:organic radical activating enzyme
MKLFDRLRTRDRSEPEMASHAAVEAGLTPEQERQLEQYCADPQVLIEITSRCNFTCDYCSSAFKDRKKIDMSMELFGHIARQLPGLTTKPVRLHIDGEPTLHPCFHEMVAMVNAQGLRVGLATNGSLLDPKWLELEMDLVITASTHPEEFLTRHKRMDFQKYVDRVVTYVQEWAKSKSSQKLMLQLIHDHGAFSGDIAGASWNSFVENLLARAEVARYCKQVPEKPNVWLKPGGRSLVLIEYPIVAGGLYPEAGKRLEYQPIEKGFCDSAWKRLAVLADGRVSYCCIDLSGGTAYTEPAAIREQPLAKLWREHPSVQRVRAAFRRGEITDVICKTCLAAAPSSKRTIGFNA